MDLIEAFKDAATIAQHAHDLYQHGVPLTPHSTLSIRPLCESFRCIGGGIREIARAGVHASLHVRF